MNKQTASHQTIKVMPMSLRDVVETHKVFVNAVEGHFEYLDDAHRRDVLRTNSLPRLALTLVRPRRVILVAKHRGQIVGYVIGSIPKSGRAQIYWLFVAPGLRGSNIGLRLLSRLLAMMERAGAESASLVTYKYAKYYTRQGFRLVDKIQHDGIEEYILNFSFGEQ